MISIISVIHALTTNGSKKLRYFPLVSKKLCKNNQLNHLRKFEVKRYRQSQTLSGKTPKKLAEF